MLSDSARDIVVGVGPAWSAEAEVAGVNFLFRALDEAAALRLLWRLARFRVGTHAQLKPIRVRLPHGVRMSSYDHQTKAGNEGDLVKHPALVAALRGLLTDHQGLFRYADAFAGRWDSDLSASDGWRRGIGAFAARWHGENPDIQRWRSLWTPESGPLYPGSTQIAQRILAAHGPYAIRAYETVEAYAVDLRRGLGDAGVYARAASAADWHGWQPDLLFLDPPGLRSPANPAYPTLDDLLMCASQVPNVLLWLPLFGDAASGGPFSPPPDQAVIPRLMSERQGLQARAVYWPGGGAFCGCLLAYRCAASAAERLASAARAVVTIMGAGWRLVREP